MINHIMVLMIIIITSYGIYKKVDIQEKFIVGVAEGLTLFKTLFPTLLSLMVVINLLQTSGIFSLLAKLLSTLFRAFSLPVELVGMILLRPLSGSGSLAFLTQIYEIFGTEAKIAKMATLIQGATDTTFYIIGLYFASIHLKKNGYSIYLCLFLDVISITLAIFLTLNFF